MLLEDDLHLARLLVSEVGREANGDCVARLEVEGLGQVAVGAGEGDSVSVGVVDLAL